MFLSYGCSYKILRVYLGFQYKTLAVSGGCLCVLNAILRAKTNSVVIYFSQV